MAEIYIYGDIIGSVDFKYWNEDTEDVAPQDIRKQLEEAKGEDVNLYINSGGGSVFAGLAIASLIKRHDGKTKAYIDGICGSIATVIALACDEVYIDDNALFMYHQSWAGLYARGNAKTIKQQADELCTVLKKINEQLLNVYEKHAVSDEVYGTIEKNLNSGKDTWLNADEAIETFNLIKYQSPTLVTYAKSEFIEIPEKYKAKQKVNKTDDVGAFGANDFLFDF